MAKADIWMPIYIGDYLRDTEELNAEEHGAYLLLLMHYWQKDGEIGCDIDRLARVARCKEETARFLLGYYFDLVDGNYKNKRADQEMKNANNRRSSARENGHNGGRPPKNNPQITGRLSENNRAVSKTKPEANPQKSSSPSSSQENTACSAREAEPVDNSPEPTVPQATTACLPAGYKTRIQEAVSSSSSRISTAEYEDISQRLFTLYPAADSAASFVAYVLERSQGKDVRNSGAMIRSALLGRPGFELWPEDYEASKRERRSETHREPTPLAPVPPACHCGGALKANRQIGQGQCVECGTFWEWDATLKEWIVSEAAAVEA